MYSGRPTEGEAEIDRLQIGFKTEARDACDEVATKGPTWCEMIPIKEGNIIQRYVLRRSQNFRRFFFHSPTSIV